MQIRNKTENTDLHLTLKYLGVFLLIFNTVLEAEVKNTMDTSDRHYSLVQGDIPLRAISHGVSQIPLHILRIYIFIEETLLLQNCWGLPWQDSFPEVWIYTQRLMFLKSKLMCSFSFLEAACRGERSSFLEGLQWDLKTLFQRERVLLIHSWYTCQYWQEIYLLKGITKISHIHMQTAVQES